MPGKYTVPLLDSGLPTRSGRSRPHRNANDRQPRSYRLNRVRTGVVLIVVLGATVLTAWLVVTLVDKVMQELRKSGHGATQREELRMAAFQALELTLGVFAEIRQMDEGLYAPAQGWGDPLAYLGLSEQWQWQSKPPNSTPGEITGDADTPDDRQSAHDGNPFGLESGELSRLPPDTTPIMFAPRIEVQVRVEDLNGKLAVAHVSEERWQLVFTEMGFEDSEASILTDSLLDWMDEDNHPRLHGAESEHYRQREPPYQAPNRPLENFDELRLVQGFEDLFFDEHGIPNEHFRRFVELVAIRPEGPLNLNSADPLFLRVLEEEIELSAERMQRFLSGPGGIRGTLDDGILRPGINTDELPRDREGNLPPLDVQSRWFHVFISTRIGENTFELEALLDSEQFHHGDIYPLRIMKLRENASRL